MNILETIIAHKKIEVEKRKGQINLSSFENSPLFSRPTFSLKKSLLDHELTGIIAEFKRKSPSRGVINDSADVVAVTQSYARHGAAALSILTDETFFGGSDGDLIKSRAQAIPILRKDFIIDPYQVIESRFIGADIILLIAACLSAAEVRHLAHLAKSLQLEVLLEIHNEEELDHICDEIDLVGVNNRDLRTFSVDIKRSEKLSELIPKEKIKITESGIGHVDTIFHLKTFGFLGFLMGESFMKEIDPAIAFASFVNDLKKGPHESKSLRHDPTRTGQKAG
jgi:indole-3-glycerol phosphate synthase